MTRSVKAKNRIDTKARLDLAGRKNPYWQRLEPGLFAGYHRPLKGGAGTWWARVMVGDRYREKALGSIADDHAAADGETVLNWPQAQAAVRAWAAKQTASGPLTIEQCCADYVANLRTERGESAAKGAADRLAKHLLPKLGKLLLADLTAEQFQAWRNGLVATGGDEERIRQSKDTSNRMLGVARAAFNFAFHTGRVTDDGAWRRVKTFKGAGEARKVILSDAEIQRLVDACGPGLRELVLLGAWTGARLGELTSARVRDLDRGGGTLLVSGKTGPRAIHLAPDALALAKRLASGKRPDAVLLTTAEGGPWTKSLHTRPFAAAVAKAGLDPATVYYSLRHSFISRAIASRVPLQSICTQAGTSLAMVSRFYAKALQADQAKHAKAAAPKLRVEPAEKIAKLRAVA